MKTVRAITRLSKKRQKQLRPLSFGNWFWKRMFALLDVVFRLPPMKRFARRYIVPRVAPQMASGDAPTEEMIAIPRTLQKMARSDKPLIVGPWLSEVGFELLYWIPFLNWVKTYRHFDPERLIVVSRGGVAPWYRDIAGTWWRLSLTETSWHIWARRTRSRFYVRLRSRFRRCRFWFPALRTSLVLPTGKLRSRVLRITANRSTPTWSRRC